MEFESSATKDTDPKKINNFIDIENIFIIPLTDPEAQVEEVLSSPFLRYLVPDLLHPEQSS